MNMAEMKHIDIESRLVRWGNWVRDHDAAALGVVPDAAVAAGSADGSAGTASAAQALAIVTANYASCNAARQQLNDLQAWIGSVTGAQ